MDYPYTMPIKFIILVPGVKSKKYKENEDLKLNNKSCVQFIRYTSETFKILLKYLCTQYKCKRHHLCYDAFTQASTNNNTRREPIKNTLKRLQYLLFHSFVRYIQ